MANDDLKSALKQAGLTAEEFADIIRVDPKSVKRWLAGTTTPYPRHRATIARALGLADHELWPDDTPPQIKAHAGEPQGGASEASGTWAYATGEKAPDLVAFIEASAGPIDLLDNGRGIELTTALLEAIVEQANTGRNVRLLTCLPNLRLEPLIGQEHIEIRVIDTLPSRSLLRAGDTMLLAFNLAREADQPPPLLKLDRTAAGGLSDRLAENLDTVWDDTDETLTGPVRLDAYLTNASETTSPRSGPVPQDWACHLRPSHRTARRQPERARRVSPNRPKDAGHDNRTDSRRLPLPEPGERTIIG
jgi:transcriptional regulator with XRE-family HTH domain